MHIIHGKLFTFRQDAASDSGIIEDGYMIIENKKIKAAGPITEYEAVLKEQAEQTTQTEPPAQTEQEELLDVSGAWVLPGLIDAHCHAGISEEKWGSICDDCNETTSPVTPYLRAIDAVNPMDDAFHDAIMSGITSVMTGPGSSNIVGGQSVCMKVQGRNIDQMILKAPAAMKIAFGENPKVNYGDKDMMPYSRMATAGLLREELFQAKEYYEQKKSGQAVKQDFRKECWIPVFEKQIPLKAHVHRADDILTAVRIGKEFGLDMTLDHCTEGHFIADEIKASGYPAILGPGLSSRSKIEVKNMSFKTAGQLHKAGVKIAVMSDHPVSLIRYLPVYAGLCVRHGLPMLEGLKAVTINAAEICGVSSRIGSLEPGKDADIAIYSGNPMEIFTKTLYTIIDGRIVYRLSDGD